VEVVVSPLVNLGGRPVPVGALASASVIQYDPADPAGADWYDLSLREDGTWLRKTGEAEPSGPPVGEKERRGLFEWLVGEAASRRDGVAAHRAAAKKWWVISRSWAPHVPVIAGPAART